MNPYKFPVTCSVCGGSGVGTIATAAEAWNAGSYIVHEDPTICADNLECEREAEERKRKEIEAATPQEAYGG